VHVVGKGVEATFSLKTFECLENNGFSAHAINEISRIVREKSKEFLEAWHDYQK